MKLTEAMERYDEGLYEPMMIVLHTESTFPGAVRFNAIMKNDMDLFAVYKVSATKHAEITAVYEWLRERGAGRALDVLPMAYSCSDNWQLLSASEFLQFIKYIFDKQLDPVI